MATIAIGGADEFSGPGQAPAGRENGAHPTKRGVDVMMNALRQESHNAEASADVGRKSDGGGLHEPAGETGGPAEPQEPSGGWTGMLIQILAIAVLAAGITLVALKYSGLLNRPAVKVVTFDVLKYENAERAQAMKLMGQSGAAAVAPMLSYVSKRLSLAIRTAAGPGTLVVLSQAVVQGQTRDITNQVLQELGLPTKVPTSSPIKASSLVPATSLPQLTGNPHSPLAQLLESGHAHKPQSIVP